MIVSAEKVLAGSGMGPVGEDSAALRQGANDPDAGWKGVRPGVRLKTGRRAGRSPKNTSAAKDSVIFSGGDSSKNYGADQQRLQISDLHFDKFPTPATFACWKIRFKTELCTCSQFPTGAMQWIKEVGLVDSVDEL